MIQSHNNTTQRTRTSRAESTLQTLQIRHIDLGQDPDPGDGDM